MTLAEWLKATNTTQDDLARRLKVRQATVSKLANQKVGISLPLALAIERETGGKVPVSIWADSAA